MKWSWAIVLTASVAACEPEACEEDPRAQVLDAHVELMVAGEAVDAELADDETARERGWKFRRCDLEALWLVPDAPGDPLPVWGCGLVEPLDVAFVREGRIVEVVQSLEPCGGNTDCAGCARVGEGIAVDGVLELPRGDRALAVGDEVQVVEPGAGG